MRLNAIALALLLAFALAQTGVARGEEDALPALAAPAPDDGHGKVWSLVGVSGVYGLAVGWVFLHYYGSKTAADHMTIQSDGWFGADTYAGGADKLGHLWGNYALTRGGSQLLIRGGWSPLSADIVSASLALTFYTWSEITDGYYGWGFSSSDMVFNVMGNGLGVLVRRWPALDRALDLRIAYFPSERFRDNVAEKGFTSAGEDYTGQTVMLAFHLKELPPVRAKPALRWLQYVDLTLGYKTEDYEPAGDHPTQRVYLGLALDLEHVLRGVRGPGGDAARFAAEVWAPPLTYLDLAGVEHVTSR